MRAFRRTLQINRIFRRRTFNGTHVRLCAIFRSAVFTQFSFLLRGVQSRLIIRGTPGVTVVRHTMLPHGGSLRWPAEKLKRGLFYSRRCTRQVAARTAEQVFAKTAKARGPLPFYPPPLLSSYILSPRLRGNTSRVQRGIPFAFSFPRIFDRIPRTRHTVEQSTIKGESDYSHFLSSADSSTN